MINKLLFILLIAGSTGARSQPLLDNKPGTEYCTRENPLSGIIYADSIGQQVILDSVNRLLIGQWQLVNIGTKTYWEMPVPEDSIKMSIDGQGNATVYKQGSQLIDFHLAAGINYGNLRCVISEVGRAYFNLRTSLVSDGQGGLAKGKLIYPNGIRVCEEYLELYAFRSHSPNYVFRRLHY